MPLTWCRRVGWFTSQTVLYARMQWLKRWLHLYKPLQPELRELLHSMNFTTKILVKRAVVLTTWCNMAEAWCNVLIKLAKSENYEVELRLFRLRLVFINFIRRALPPAPPGFSHSVLKIFFLFGGFRPPQPPDFFWMALIPSLFLLVNVRTAPFDNKINCYFHWQWQCVV